MDASATKDVPADEDKTEVRISFGSGNLSGYFIKDQCILGDPEKADNQL